MYRKKPLTLEDIEQFQDPKQKKETLSNLIEQLKSRAEIEEGFSDFLEAYLTRRNDFIHGLATRLSGDLRTEEERDIANGLFVRT
jgi:hypothetical protein